MKTRLATYFDTKENKYQYGIEANVKGEWRGCADGDKPLLFDTIADAEIKRKEIRKIKP